MKTQIPEIHAGTRALLENAWRLSPARMAEHLTDGRFQRYRHVRYLEKKIAQAIGQGGARLIISMPPRHGKSWLASLFTPAWYLSLWPEKRVILASHDASLAMAWGREVRGFLRQHQAELEIRLNESSEASQLWATAQGGGMTTAGIGGPISGRGGDLLIIDDPLKSWADASSESVRERQIDWFNSTFYTRAEPGASIIVTMTRWHERDLAGYLETEHGEKWQVLRIPAIAEEADVLERSLGAALCEERYGLEALEQIRKTVGSRVWDALYQQRPGAVVGKVIKREWLRSYEVMPDSFDEVVQSWDLSFKGTDTSDYVVGQVWGRRGANKYLIDQVRGKMDFPATVRAVQELSTKYPQCGRIFIEDKANGSAVVATLQDFISGIVVVQPKGGKEARVAAISHEIESGNVFLPAKAGARWVEEFVSECVDFPNGKHDDQVDAMAYALHHMKQGA